MRKGPAVTDDSAGGPGSDSGATTRIAAAGADDPASRGPRPTTSGPTSPDEPSARRPRPIAPPADYGGDPTREALAFDVPTRAAASRRPPHDEDVHLIPGATIAGGRYRLLVFHGGPPHLQFWHALDTVAGPPGRR